MHPGDNSKLGHEGMQSFSLLAMRYTVWFLLEWYLHSQGFFFCIVSAVFFFSSLVTEKVITSIFLFLQEEDDWKEFEQKEEVDYSGLRVQSMQIRY